MRYGSEMMMIFVKIRLNPISGVQTQETTKKCVANFQNSLGFFFYHNYISKKIVFVVGVFLKFKNVVLCYIIIFTGFQLLIK